MPLLLLLDCFVEVLTGRQTKYTEQCVYFGHNSEFSARVRRKGEIEAGPINGELLPWHYTLAIS
jgi:hypothetical protein